MVLITALIIFAILFAAFNLIILFACIISGAKNDEDADSEESEESKADKDDHPIITIVLDDKDKKT